MEDASAPVTSLFPEPTPQLRSYVFSVAMKYVKDEEAAADVAQDALLLAHRHRDSFREPAVVAEIAGTAAAPAQSTSPEPV